MSEIVEFLKARLDEDEEEARDAIAERESIDWPHPELSNRPDYGLNSWPDLSVPAVVIGPERLLREVEAKRDIILLHAPGEPWCDCGTWDTTVHGESSYEVCPTIQALAAVYADHAEYDPEWR